MDKNDLKKLLKPLIKESIKEVLMEQGLINFINESKSVQQQKAPAPIQQERIQAEKPPVNENRKRMLEEIARSGYVSGGFNPFAGTNPLSNDLAPRADGDAAVGRNTPPAMKNIDPHDPGVDISGLMGGNKQVWKALIGGKGK